MDVHAVPAHGISPSQALAEVGSRTLLLNDMADRALDSLANAGERYESVRNSVREELRNNTWTAELLKIPTDRKKTRFQTQASGFFDALSGIGDVLVVFSKEHRANKHDYANTLQSILQTTGKLGISSAVGIGAGSAAAALLGAGAAPILIGVGAAAAGLWISEKIF